MYVLPACQTHCECTHRTTGNEPRLISIAFVQVIIAIHGYVIDQARGH